MSSLGGSLRSVDWATTKLSIFEKNFYTEDKRVSSCSDREIEDFRRAKEIKVSTPFSLKATSFNLAPGSRPQCATTCNILRGGRLPRIPDVDHSCARFFGTYSYSMSGLAYGSYWKGRCCYRPNWIRENNFLRSSCNVTHQCVSLLISLLFTKPNLSRQPLLAPGDGPIALVLAPTRELAVQIQQECTKFG